MKKSIFLLLFAFVLLFSRDVFACKNIPNYTNSQFKKIVLRIAGKAGIKVKFVNINGQYYIGCSCNQLPGGRIAGVHNHYQCTLLQYTSWFKPFLNAAGSYGKEQQAEMLKAIHARPVINFKHILRRFLYARGLAMVNKNGIYYIEPPVINYQRVQYSKVNYRPIYLKALKKIDKLIPATANTDQNTYGLSKTGLRSVIFNVIQPQFYNSDVQTIQQLVMLGNFTVPSFSFDPGGAINAVIDEAVRLSNADNMVNTTLLSSFSQFNAETSNMQATYSIVNDYYSRALTAKYGTIKTQFLKYVGIGANNDISYNTILSNANIFLSKIASNNSDNTRFEKLFLKKFGEIKYKRNYIPGLTQIRHLETKITTLSMGRAQIAPLNYSALVSLGAVTHYPVINRQFVNFYSLTYYLIENIYTGRGQAKQLSIKLFRDITLSNFKAAYKVFYSIPAPAAPSVYSEKKFIFINKFFKDLKNNDFKKAYAILNNTKGLGEAVPMCDIGNNYKTVKYCVEMPFYASAYSNMKEIYYYDRLIYLKKQNAPWDKAEIKSIEKQMLM
jgi:hypothetical protein